MRKRFQNIFLLFFLLVVVGGCSTEKNTWMSRSYHNLTSHYNVYFNGRESLRSGVSKINNSVEDDFTKRLPIFKSSEPGTEQIASSDMEKALTKAIKLINVHSITNKPKRRRNITNAYRRLASKEEYNNWVDDSYVLIGKAYFYQKNYTAAIENLTYTIRKFGEEDSKYDASVWLIRCYSEAERFNEALDVIESIDAMDDFPSRLDDDFSLAVADYHIKLNEFSEAIPYLKAAIDKTGRKKDKVRYTYILAQLYQETGQDELALSSFRDVVSMNPEYEMAFNARINAAETVSGQQDSEELVKELNKMLRDKKNEEFQDQIYYALGNIFWNEGNKSTAIDNYRKSVSYSLYNMYQRALSSLTLAEIYFNDQNYTDSQNYYDSAMVVIDTNYPNYDIIQQRYTSLTHLTDNLYTVQLEDSLQNLASMSEADRNALIDTWISEAQEEQLRQEQTDAQALSDQSFYRANQYRLGLSQQSQGSGWYFYNPTMVSLGRTEFQRLWGERQLADNWNRKNTSSGSIGIDSEEDAENAEEAVPEETRVEDRFSREYYTQDLPLTEEEMERSNNRIKDALFNAGRIFEDDFENYPMAIESYEELLQRYQDNTYRLITCFELWDLYNKTGNAERTNYYRTLIINDYPDSKYAKYLINPNYFIELEALNDSIDNMYQQAFQSYQQGRYSEAGSIAKQVMSMGPDSLLLPKVAYIEAIGEGSQASLDEFGNKLQNYILTYPESPVRPLAENIYQLIQDSTLVNYQQLVAMGYLHDEIQNEEVFLEDQADNDEFGGKFSYDENLLHYFVIAYPRSANVDINRLKFDIANYNIDHYTRIDFDMETENLNPQTVLLVVRSLEDKEQSLIYFRSIIRQRDVFESLEGIDYANFVASSYNYREILSDNNTTEYLKFFIKNYSRFIGNDFPQDELPEPEELMARAEEEDNALEERGTFVVVKPETGQAVFTRDNQATQNFVIAVDDPSFDVRDIMSGFTSYNRSDFDQMNLTLKQNSFGDYRLLVVGSFPSIQDALTYFRLVVLNRRLYNELETRSYRNFLISDDNLEILAGNGDMDSYMNFFRSYYLNGEFANEDQEAETVPVQEANQGNTSVDDVNVDETVETAPAYSGSFNTETAGIHSFILILPNDAGIDTETVKSSIDNFNAQNYPDLGLQTDELEFDTGNIMMRVSGFDGKDTGMEYIRSIVQDNSVYGSLSEVNYRNFIISDTNYTIFLENKDVNSYLEFYRTFYLNL